ncbi:MAG: DUF3006 domain-containing protein [Thermotaleaceae bacterium]
MFVLDRIEGDRALIEWGEEIIEIPLVLLPTGVKEGDLLRISISIEENETEARKERLEEKAKRLWE